MNRLVKRGSCVAPWLVAATLGVAACSNHGALPQQASLYKVNPVQLLHGNGLAFRRNIVIVGDGFTASTLGAYRSAAQAFVTKLLSVSPFGALGDAFNVYRVDVLSNQDGIDVPDTCGASYVYAAPPPPHPQPADYARDAKQRDTALATSWCADGNYYGITSQNDELVWDAAVSAGVFPDMIIVLVNDWMYGARAFAHRPIGKGSGGIAYVSIEEKLMSDVNPLTSVELQPDLPIAFPDVAVHELGHLGPFLLLDEYGEKLPPISTADQARINASPNLSLAPVPPTKWDALNSPGSAVLDDCTLSPLPQVGAVARGFRYASGVYHARCECKMNRYVSPEFCVVCRGRVMDVLDSFIPPVPPNQPFSPLLRVRVLLDSMRIKKGPIGPPSRGDHYFMSARLTSGSSTTAARWPARNPTRYLTMGNTDVSGDVLFDVASLKSGPVTISFELRRASSPDGSDGSIVERGTVSLEIPPAPGSSIRLFDFATYTLTIGLIAR